MSNWTKYRKAIAAGITPLLGLPIAGWISGDIDFSPSLLAGAIVGAVGAVLTWWFPNTPA